MFQREYDITPFTTFGVPATANFFGKFSTLEDLKVLLKEKKSSAPLLILGGGSNVLFISDFNGVVLCNQIKGIEKIKEDDSSVYLKVGAGEIWHEFVLHAIRNNWGGIENLSLIPGSVGASPMQNIGAYGVEIKDVFISLEAIEIKSGLLRTFTHKECKFGYRESVFKNELKGQYVITSVTYRLTKNPTVNAEYGTIKTELKKKGIKNPTIKDVSEVIISIRQSKLPDPKEIGNAGSFFKNPIIPKVLFKEIKKRFPDIPSYRIDKNTVKVPAGWLIDHAGWKGKRIEDYGVHKNQALVLVNYGRSSGQAIFDLSKRIIEDINEKYGIELKREVNVIK